MRVHHISSCDFTGGAARAGYRLHRGLLSTGVDSVWLDAHADTEEKSTVKRINRPWTSQGILKKLKGSYQEDKNLRRAFKDTSTFSSRYRGWGHPKALLKMGKPDVFHLHWVSNFLDWDKCLPALAEIAPIIWTLHDMNPIMGAWHYVPDVKERNAERDQIENEIVKRKRRALKRIPIDKMVFVAPSRWMAECCRQSEITSRFETVQIPNGIDSTRFAPLPKQKAKAALGVSGDQPVLGFLAYDLKDPRKGMDLLCDALKGMNREYVPLLLTLGRASSIDLEGVQHQSLGIVNDDETIQTFYSACDLFVCPSRQDNLPNTVLESLACGTPVAGFRIGGLPDMVIDGVTGKLAPEICAESLCEIIADLLTDSHRLTTMGKQAREHFLANFSERIQTKAALDLYHRVLNSKINLQWK